VGGFLGLAFDTFLIAVFYSFLQIVSLRSLSIRIRTILIQMNWQTKQDAEMKRLQAKFFGQKKCATGNIFL